MMEWIKHAVVRSPFEGPFKAARQVFSYSRLLRRPEQFEMVAEEARIARFIKKAVGPASNCVDVGCHLGLILSLIVRRSPAGRHVAYEPNPTQSRWLSRKFPEVDVRRKAVSDRDGELDFHIHLDRSGYSGLKRLGGPAERVETLTVPVVRLDDDLPPDLRVDFLKIVIEGAELSAMRGASGLLRRDRPIILFESAPPNLAEFGESPSTLFDYLTSEHSYAIYLIKDYLVGGPPLDRDQFDKAQTYPFQALKFVAAPAAVGGLAVD